MNQTNTTVSNEEIMEFLKKFYNEFLGEKAETKSFKEEMRSFKQEMYEFKQEMYEFKQEMYDFKQEMQNFRLQTENRFQNIENKLSNQSEKLEIINTKLNHQASLLEKQDDSIKEIWHDRKELKLGLTKSLLTVTGVLSGAIAIVVSFFTGKAITYSIK